MVSSESFRENRTNRAEVVFHPEMWGRSEESVRLRSGINSATKNLHFPLGNQMQILLSAGAPLRMTLLLEPTVGGHFRLTPTEAGPSTRETLVRLTAAGWGEYCE